MNLEKEAELNEQDLRRDAKRRKQQWDGEGDGIVVFVIIVAVAIIVAEFVLRIVS